MNGNANYSNKDLIIHVLNKVDKVEEKITKQTTFCKTHMDEKKSFKNNIFQIVTFVIAVLAVVVGVYG
jgi:hypothetical protein